MQWLQDKSSVTKEHLLWNRRYASDLAYPTTHAASCSSCSSNTEKYLGKYFDLSGDNKQDYFDELKNMGEM